MRQLFVQKLSHKELTRHLFIPQTTVVRLKRRCPSLLRLTVIAAKQALAGDVASGLNGR